MHNSQIQKRLNISKNDEATSYSIKINKNSDNFVGKKIVANHDMRKINSFQNSPSKNNKQSQNNLLASIINKSTKYAKFLQKHSKILQITTQQLQEKPDFKNIIIHMNQNNKQELKPKSQSKQLKFLCRKIRKNSNIQNKTINKAKWYQSALKFQHNNQQVFKLDYTLQNKQKKRFSSCNDEQNKKNYQQYFISNSLYPRQLKTGFRKRACSYQIKYQFI